MRERLADWFFGRVLGLDDMETAYGRVWLFLLLAVLVAWLVAFKVGHRSGWKAGYHDGENSLGPAKIVREERANP